ncbi:hypothetical protein [Sporosarcina sp.]|uniref:hypothetical protein n=1 Tax=Sporosarcina sp. TaxID=49982 RepID=UPI00260371D0|nr:hypothetical protein [Sporosarcina sp.]
MDGVNYILLGFHFLLIIALYRIMKKRKKRMPSYFGSHVAMFTGGGFSLGLGVILIHSFPVHYLEVTACTALSGMLIGSIFGAMFGNHTMLTGYGTGLLLGLLSPLLGITSLYSFSFILIIELFIFCSFIVLVIITNTSRKEQIE